MAHDEDYLMTFCSFLFFSRPVYIYFLMMKYIVHFTLFILHAHFFPFLFCFRKKEEEEEEALSMLSLRYHLEVMDVVVSVPRKGYM